MRVTYNTWWRKKKKPQSDINTLSQLDIYNKTNFSKQKSVDSELLEMASFEAHKDKKIYFATIYNQEQPVNFLEVNNDYILVGFLDTQKRHYLSYVFSEIKPGKLFLKEVQYWEHKGVTDEKITSTRYFFTPEGKLTIEEVNLVTNEVVTKEAKNKIDVSSHWEDYPEFGKYEKLIIKERLLPS